MPTCHFDAWLCLTRLRLIWWTLLLIQLMPLIAGRPPRPVWTPRPPMPALGATLVLMVIFLLGNWWRGQRYKRGWVVNTITERAYCFGNLPLLGGLAGFAAWAFARGVDGPLDLVTLGPAAFTRGGP